MKALLGLPSAYSIEMEMPSGNMNSDLILFVKNVFFAILLPGTVTVLVPYLIVSDRRVGIQWNAGCLLALVPLTVGIVVLLRCIWDFAVSGRGTLAPVDPPKNLVVRGFYRYVRNPMYFGVLLILSGETWLFRSQPLLLYIAAGFVAINGFVLLYEEPHLRRRFGDTYAQYCRTVPRWVPRWPRR